MQNADLDRILELQLAVAWAGEADTTPRRLGWWRTTMSDEYGGEDLLRRLAPRTWQWAVLESSRAAARKVDDRARASADDADHLVSLFRLGFEIDDRLEDRLLELKLAGVPPIETFTDLAELLPRWSKEEFESWIEGRRAKCGSDKAEASYSTTATGRRLRGDLPADPVETATRLTAALTPCADAYVLPHYRIRR